MPKGKYKLTPQQIEKGVDTYIKKCIDNGKVPLMVEFCLDIGLSQEALTDYRKLPQYEASIKRLDNEQEKGLIRHGLDHNKPVFPIFLLKSKFGYQETQKIDLTSNGETLGVVQLPPKKA